ncbi:RIP metalloprotease RseP [bacterium]|nr:RIP metalloprotease RseP [bacterium]
MLLTLVSFIVVLGIVIFIHELGHFLAARLSGARVEVFSIGFPPKMVGFQRGDTEYRIGWIPLGGYVKIAGMIDESLDGEETLTGAPDEFMSKSYPQKVFMLSAGVIMNFLLGFLLYSFIAFTEGKPVADPSAVIGSVVQGYPAQEAGLQAGDRIIALDGNQIHTWDELTSVVHPRPADTLDVTWVRAADTLSATVVTRADEVSIDGTAETRGMIGIGPDFQREPVGFFEAFAHGGETTGRIVVLTLQMFGRLFTGQASIDELTGPVGIVHLSGETARAGWATFLSFIALINISIGLLNIMPFPVLDGGHIVFVTLEAILRRQISTRVKVIVQQVGMVLLLLLMVVVTYNDILRFFMG